ncbi:MAG: hypothetical protein WKF30_18465 [Pyrinomonadaceae bacterium]
MGASGIEIAGGLVGEQHARTVGERAGDGDALLLAARKFRGPVAEPVVKPTRPSKRRVISERARRWTPPKARASATFSCAVIVGIRL